MNLRKFVSQSLQDIIGGVQDAQKVMQSDRSDAVVAPTIQRGHRVLLERPTVQSKPQDIQYVHFDVGVTVSTSGVIEMAGTADVSLLGKGVKATGEGSATHERGSVSRIQFDVPVAFPRPDKDAQPAEK